MTNDERLMDEMTSKRVRALQYLEDWSFEADPYKDRLNLAQDEHAQLHGAWRALYHLNHPEAEAVKALYEEVGARITHLLNS